MVKGISKRVVVVKSPDPRLFEQAIFIVRDDVFNGPGVNSDQILQEACRVANAYIRQNTRTIGKKRFPIPLILTTGGAAAAAAVWLILTFFVT